MIKSLELIELENEEEIPTLSQFLEQLDINDLECIEYFTEEYYKIYHSL